MKPEKREIKRVGIFSAVKTGFLLGGFGGFLLGIFQWIAVSFMISIVQRAAEMTGEFVPELGLLSGVGIGGMGVFLLAAGGIGGAVVGVVFGLVLSWWYNTGVAVWGGLEIELAVPAQAAPAAIPVRREPHGETALPRIEPPSPLHGSSDSPMAPPPSGPA